MPNLNGRGPLGDGPMTGRKKGRCRETQKTLIENAENRQTENKDIIYGIGRGGRRREGDGLGNRLGGGFGNGQGRCRRERSDKK